MRITEHPILGSFEKGKKITFTLDGDTMEGCDNEPIAAALRAQGVLIHRITERPLLRHRPVYGLRHDG